MSWKFNLDNLMKNVILIFFATSFSYVLAQQNIIDNVFKDLPIEKRSQLEIIDSLSTAFKYVDTYYYSEYYAKFEGDQIQKILVYQNKEFGKKGLIILGENSFYASEAIADSIYLIGIDEVEYTESYDLEGNFINGNYFGKKVNFSFSINGQEYLYTLTFADSKYNLGKSGNIKRSILKAVSFEELAIDEYTNYIKGVFADIKTDQLIRSSILNEEIVKSQVYSYKYDHYYGEYEYFETAVDEYAYPVFESRLNYEPIEILYIEKGDSIHELIHFDYLKYNDLAYMQKIVPSNFSGVFTDKNYVTDNLLIFEDDEIYTAYATVYASMDAYNFYVFETGNLENELSKANLAPNEIDQIKKLWLGSTEKVNFVSLTSFTYQLRFKDYFFYNDQVLIYVFKEYNEETGKASVNIRKFDAEKVFKLEGLAHYNNYYYTTDVIDNSGNKIPLSSAGIDYYYNYNPSVSKKNIDDNGNLVLTNESIGNIQLKTFSPGNFHLGKVLVSWIGSNSLNENAQIVSIKSLPYDIKDESGKVFAANIQSMFITNVQGLNIFQITNENNKVGILGPNGETILPQIYDVINVVGPQVDDYYASVAFPVFFIVYENNKCGVMDAAGRVVIPMGKDFIELCENEFIVNSNEKTAIYSLDGKVLIEGLDTYASSSGDYNYEGYATYDGYGYYGVDCYTLNSSQNGCHVLSKNLKYGLVDKNYNVIVPFAYQYIYALSTSNSFVATDTNGMTGIIDNTGKIVVPFEYEKIVNFDYSVNRFVAAKDGKEGVIDEKGNVLIPFNFYSIGTYSVWEDNLLYISDPDYQTNIIDTNGKSIIDAMCGYIYLYSGYNVIFCSNEGKYDFYNMNGELIYTKVAEYIDPYACYGNIQIYESGSYENPKFGAFNLATGEELMPAEFDNLYPIWINDRVYYVADKKGKVGIYDSNGNLIVKHKYYNIDNYFYEDGYYGGEVGYYVEMSKIGGETKMIKLPE